STAAFCPPLQYALNCGRPVPDIAMDADINISPGAYFSGGSPNGQGGTSLASPLSLGSWARIEAAHAERLGFAAPLLYAAYQSPGFHDVVLGDSGPYPATPGWDFATGLGSFDVGKMAAVIEMPAPRIAGKVTYYLHGSQVVDEVGSPPIASSGYLSMDASGPSGTAKSHQITSYVLGPNTDCAGNNFFPVWLGALHGTVRGTITIKLYTVSTPAANVEVDLWRDISSQVCVSSLPGGASSLPKALGSAIVALPAGDGSITVTFKNVDAAVAQGLMLQVKPTAGPGGTIEPIVARAFYDSSTFPASVSFDCTPFKGTQSC
ncbi:MAG: hypothetical protein ACYDB7_06860, partial [Mycobacteriales bacterium]